MLTKRQADTLAFIVAYTKKNNGVSPSFVEICAHLGSASKSHVYGLLQRLEIRGFIRRLPGRARGIEVLREGVHAFESKPADPKDEVLGLLLQAKELLGRQQWKGSLKAIIAAASIESAIQCMQDAFEDVAA